MRREKLLTCAALGVTILIPASSGFAKRISTNVTTTETTVTRSAMEPGAAVMDAGQFRDSLHELQGVLQDIRNTETLELASADPLLTSQYQRDNRNKLDTALSILNSISQNWRHSNVVMTPGANTDRLGTADAVRFANESPDTAFVRNTVWDIQNTLHADKLNGRDPSITNDLMSSLQAAINRAENPSFRVASATIDTSRIDSILNEQSASKAYDWGPLHGDQTASNSTSSNEFIRVTPTRGGTADDVPDNGQVASNTVTEQTTTVDRAGAADLPQTGGDPGMLVALGGTFMGLGALLRRRKAIA